MLLSFYLTDTGLTPANVMGHGADRFVETLLSTIVTTFISLCDGPDSTNAREVWKKLHPSRAAEIDEVWEREILAGEKVMRQYRNKAGAHGDSLHKYLDAKTSLIQEKEVVLRALRTFLGLSTSLFRDQESVLPTLPADIESVLLDVELSRPELVLNRRWLRSMHLTESGPFTKKFR
jgi:hypothetical protein